MSTNRVRWRRLIGAALLLAVGAAQASDWVSLGKTDDGKQEIFVDVSSVRVEGDIRRAWMKFVVAPHTLRGTGPNSRKWASNSVRRDAYNCRNETHKLEALTVYFEDGTNDSYYPSAAQWEPVAPDTVSDTVMRFVCAWKPL
jgi:hypothetical protein